MPTRLEQILRSNGYQYSILHHSHSSSSMRSAEAAHVPGECVAKAVLLEDGEGYAAAVLPATHRLRLSELWKQTGRPLVLAEEEELRDVFPDSAPGAVPPVGTAYGLETYIDRSLLEKPEVYFEAGDHEALVHMDCKGFAELMRGAKPVDCAYHM